jgi:hypothetical protein
MNTYTHQIGEDVGDLFKIISLNWHTKIRDYYECSHIDSHNPKKKKKKEKKRKGNMLFICRSWWPGGSSSVGNG